MKCSRMYILKKNISLKKYMKTTWKRNLCNIMSTRTRARACAHTYTHVFYIL